MLYSFLTELGYKCNYLLHDKNPKAHGLDDAQIMQQLKELEPSLLLIPDAGSSDDKPCGKLKKLGWEIAILDHHTITCENTNAIVVNCQTSNKVVNKSASGCLVTWHLMHLIDPDLANKYISYVAISIISDSMSFLTNENITFIYRGLQGMHPNIKDLVDSVQKDYYPLSMSFGGVIPKVNSTIRLGTIEEKKMMFELMCGKDIEYAKVSKIIKHYHSQQNTEASDLLENHVSIDNEDAVVLLCKLDCKTPLTGLVANKLMGKTGKPVLMLHDRDDGNCDGSVRSPIPIRDILNDSGLFNYNSGHVYAMGTSYKQENEEQVKEFLYNLDLPEPSYDVYQVGFTKRDIEPFGDLKMLWGNDLTEPQYYVKMEVCTDMIDVIGKAGTTIKFFDNDGMTYIKFFCTHEWIDKLKAHKKIIVEMIGKGQWNEWNGTKTPQFVIDRIEFREPSFEDLF
jgi:single-stranded DNA-specific DHH superfamily exonuclease